MENQSLCEFFFVEFHAENYMNCHTKNVMWILCDGLVGYRIDNHLVCNTVRSVHTMTVWPLLTTSILEPKPNCITYSPLYLCSWFSKSIKENSNDVCVENSHVSSVWRKFVIFFFFHRFVWEYLSVMLQTEFKYTIWYDLIYIQCLLTLKLHRASFNPILTFSLVNRIVSNILNILCASDPILHAKSAVSVFIRKYY